MSMKEMISGLVDKYFDDIQLVNDTIWEYAEPGMKETKSAEFYGKFFEERGFKVDMGVGEVPTAFVASWGEGQPIVGFLGEYDALPLLSQEASCAEKKPIVEGAYGQGCGHNSLGAAAAGAALAFRDYLKENNLPGTVRYYGCPGEEYGSGKVFMARNGLFDDLACAFTWHPGDMNQVKASSSLACISAFFEFTGVTAHAAANPHLGRSALDACELMNVGVNYLREHIVPEARVHYAYLNAGGIAPNVVHDKAKIHYFVRAPKIKTAQEIFVRVQDIAEGAAKMTGTTMQMHFHEALSDCCNNRTLEKLMHETFLEIGAPAYDAEDFKLAEAFRNTFTDADKADVATALRDNGMDPDLIPMDAALHTDILPYVPMDKAQPGSTDVGDVSYCTPTAQCNVATVALATPGHSWQMTAQSRSSIANKGNAVAAKVMALTAAKAIADPELLAKAKEELVKATGGKYECPIPAHVKPTL
ncbi:MAG: amidohydrolase [Clostridia bacterium]|nr:amidohydrolase [Clostridia bacterium]MBQ3092476.1 amidohydrolase [Clostridia bacterium]MBQ9926270.1 amidohydrolase [Clostridia bacterium]